MEAQILSKLKTEMDRFCDIMEIERYPWIKNLESSCQHQESIIAMVKKVDQFSQETTVDIKCSSCLWHPYYVNYFALNNEYVSLFLIPQM